MSLGEDRVRIQFNPSNNGKVEVLKTRMAQFINDCEDYKKGASNPEELRLWALAQTHAEDAAMWAVKAATI